MDVAVVAASMPNLAMKERRTTMKGIGSDRLCDGSYRQDLAAQL